MNYEEQKLIKAFIEYINKRINERINKILLKVDCELEKRHKPVSNQRIDFNISIEDNTKKLTKYLQTLNNSLKP